jgi:hypothetical protein
MRFDSKAKKKGAAPVRVAGVLLCAGLAWMAYAPAAMARVIVPGINAPAIAATPSPPLQIPAIPQAGVPLQATPSPMLQNTFSDRVGACMQAGSAAGLSSGGLGSYTAQCANQ